MVPPSKALAEMLEQEAASEAALIRKGEAAALARINHLKAANATQERTIALLTASLASQHEILQDVEARVTALAQALPRPVSQQQQSTQASPSWEAVYAAIQTLHRRLQRGTSARGSASIKSTPPSR